MSFYSDMAATAHELLGEFGATVTLVRTIPGAYDAETGTTGTPTVQTWTGRGAAFEYESAEINDTNILRGDLRVYLSVVGMGNPLQGDALTIAGQTYKVIGSRPLQPALVAVLFDAQVRK